MLKKTLSIFLALLMAVSVVPFFKTQTGAAGIAITLDPGHGQGTGAAGAMTWGGLQEDHYNLTISEYCKARLESYGFTVHMTRTSHNENPSYDARVMTAVNTGSDAFVSIHNNSNGSSTPYGSMIFMVNPNYNYQMYVNTVAMSRCIMDRLVADAGTYEWAAPYYTNGDSTHPDGSAAEYYAVLWRAKRWSEGVYSGSNVSAGLIVECVFQSNYSDVVNFLMNPAKLEAMGYAIADGLADYYGVDAAPSGPAHVNNIDDTDGMTSRDTTNAVIQCAATVEKGTTFIMKGWSVNENGVSTYQGSLDGGDWTNINSYFREDVYNAMADYTVCSDINSFDVALDTSSLSFGNHTYDIRCVTKNNETYDVASYDINITVPAGVSYVNVLSNAFAPGGNFMVTAKGASDLAWVGLFGANETPGQVNSYCYYEMQTAGVEYTFDLIQDGVASSSRGTPAPGNYKLVLFADESSSIIVDEVPVVVVGSVQYSLDTKGPFEVAQGDTVHISGWGASMDGMKGYVYSIDGVRADGYMTTGQRQDVVDHLTNSGYTVTISDVHAFVHNISTAAMTPGTHTISVIGITNTDVEYDIGSAEITVTAPAVVEKIEGSVTIDRDTDADTAYITDIDLNTTAEELLAKFTKDGCVIKDKSGNTATGKLGTGCTVELIINGVVHDKAIIIVTADLDGDAMATSKDVILAKMYRNAQTGGNVAKLASDFDGNGTVSATDLTSIAQAVAAN